MYYHIFSIALGALLLVLGVCDVCKRKITWGYSSRMKPKEREIWQRWVGVLELILAVCEFSYVFLTKMQRATSFLFAVLVLYGDNVFEKCGINRDGAGEVGKPRYSNGKRHF